MSRRLDKTFMQYCRARARVSQISLLALLALLALLTLSASRSTAKALEPDSTDVRAILREALDRQAGTRTKARVRMHIRDSAGKSERTLTMRSQRRDEARKTIILIEEPADLRNTGFLSIDYRTSGRADEQWLYLPKLHRVSRVPNSGKADSFVGSDFSIADLSPQDPTHFEAKLLDPAVKVGDELCWFIEAVPRDRAAVEESGYAKLQLWVSKKKGMTVQLKGWVATGDGKQIKYLKVGDLRQVDGIWTAYRLQMRTLEGSKLASETIIETLDVDNDASEVSDTDFTQQRLEHGV